MDITYLGHSSFRIKGKSATLVTDPYDAAIGMKFPKHIAADIVTVSHGHKDHAAIDQIEGNPYILRGPGEYEIKGVGIIGLPDGTNTVYRIEIDGVSIVHLGDLGHTLSAGEVDSLDGVGILMIPVGGTYTIDPAKAVEVVQEVEPAIVIPMHYARKELDVKTFGGLSPLAVFLKEIGKEDVTAQPKLSVTRDKLPAEMQVVVLE